MLTISECQKKLNKKGVHYTNEEIQILRSFLYRLAEIQISQLNELY